MKLILMLRIGLVACAKRKLDHKSRAEDLYASTLFSKAKEYAEKNYEEWFILSAKYHLVDPNQEIDPYDESLNSKEVYKKCSRELT